VTSELEVEATGETVGEAKWGALRQLERLHPGLDKGAVRFQVISEGKRGLLGVGYAPARVLATAPDAQTAEPAVREGDSPLAGDVRTVLERITHELGIDCRLELDEGDDTLVARLVGSDLGLAIGKHGQTIDAIQYLVNAIVWRRRPEGRKEVIVDAAGYRERRRTVLEALATRSAEQALASGRPVELDAMTAVERKVVHVYLKEVGGIETTSEGTEPNRYVVITPLGA